MIADGSLASKSKIFTLGSEIFESSGVELFVIANYSMKITVSAVELAAEV